LNVTLDEVKANFAFFGLLDEQVWLRRSIPRTNAHPAGCILSRCKHHLATDQ
jgi:hypothetical protein